jgi:hypothetical protein
MKGLKLRAKGMAHGKARHAILGPAKTLLPQLHRLCQVSRSLGNTFKYDENMEKSTKICESHCELQKIAQSLK